MGYPKLRCVIVSPSFLIFIVIISSSLTPLPLFCAVKRQPKLKSRYKGRVEKAIVYMRTIEDFDDLVDL